MDVQWIQRDVIDHLINFLTSSNCRTQRESVLDIGASRSGRIARIAVVAKKIWYELDGKIHVSMLKG